MDTGVILGSVLTLVGGLGGVLLQSWQADARENRRERRRMTTREDERHLESDAAAWRLVKRALDDLAYQTRLLATPVKPADNGGTILNAPVDQPNAPWADAYNRYARVLQEVSFSDDSADSLLKELQKDAIGYGTSASMVTYLRAGDQQARAYGVPPSGHWIPLDDEARKLASKIDDAQRRVNLLIMRTVGFHRVYLAPLIEPGPPADDPSLVPTP